jgi:ribonucleotide reductase alpha subunit
MMMRIFNKYSKEEIDTSADSFIDHDRDFLFTYAGLRQVVDKYLVQDRSTGQVYETPTIYVHDDCSDYLCRVSKRNQNVICQEVL